MRQLQNVARHTQIKTVELRRPDSSHSWGICYAVLPGGPEILKVLTESPGYGHCQSGQVIKRINGQSVGTLKREEINEILNIDEETVILELADATPIDTKPLIFARDYGRGSVEPTMLKGRRNSGSLAPITGRRGSNCCVEMPSNLPNCREEFQRIYAQRKLSREDTINKLENIRLQRAVSEDRAPNRQLPPHQTVETGELHTSKNRPGLPLNSISNQPQVTQPLGSLKELPVGPPAAKDIRYMGVQIPSRSFRALATLMGMDPSGSDISAQNTQAASKESCRTVIDVRGTAEAMRKNSTNQT